MTGTVPRGHSGEAEGSRAQALGQRLPTTNSSAAEQRPGNTGSGHPGPWEAREGSVAILLQDCTGRFGVPARRFLESLEIHPMRMEGPHTGISRSWQPGVLNARSRLRASAQVPGHTAHWRGMEIPSGLWCVLAMVVLLLCPPSWRPRQ